MSEINSKFLIEYSNECVSVEDDKGNEWCWDYEDSMSSIAIHVFGMLVSAGADVEIKEL